jgi:crossover junction endodeoxyribonuclease RusA
MEIYGTPATQGSHRAFIRGGRAVITNDSENTRPWRDTVRHFAMAGRPAGWMPLDGPVWVRMTFSLRRPQSASKKVVYPAKKPDIDKAVRLVLDSLTEAGLWHDDGQVVDLHARKVFAGSDDPDALDVPGVKVVVSDADPFLEWYRRPWSLEAGNVAEPPPIEFVKLPITVKLST